MPEFPSDSLAVADDVWTRFEAALQAAGATPEPRDRAVLAILYVADALGVSVKRARETVARSGAVGPIPSGSTITRHRNRLEPLLRRLTAADATGDDPAAALRAAIGGWSYPAFCARLRREHGLLWDPVHLQRALHPKHPKRLPGAVVATVLRHATGKSQGKKRRAQPCRALSPAAAAQRFKDALAYEKRLPGEPGAFAMQLWRLTAGQPDEVDLLADRVRAWVARKTKADPVSMAWDADAMLTAAWTEVTRAQTLNRAGSRRSRATPALSPLSGWCDLANASKRVVAALAALPGREWSPADLMTIAAGAEPCPLDTGTLVDGGWLVPVPATARETTYSCPPESRRYVCMQREARRFALEGLAHLWRYLVVPRLRRESETRRHPYKTLTAVFEGAIGEPLVVDCLDLVASVVRDYKAAPGRATLEEVALAAELLRWMWRALSDILEPSGHLHLHVRLGRVADEALGLLPPDRTAADPRNGEWAGLAAEHTLIVAERGFVEWEAGHHRTCRAVLVRARGMLPPLDTILTLAGAERECLLTALQSVIQYGILLARDDLETHLRRTRVRIPPLRAAVRRLAALRQHLAALESGEAADEATKGLTPDGRWNYPALARWDRGRTQARYQYWQSVSLLAEARGTRLIDPRAAESLLGQAAEKAATATRLYRRDATKNAKWDRVVHALLHQGEIEREAGHPIAAATWTIRAATQALTALLEGETQHLALVCQLEAAAALLRLAPLYAAGEWTTWPADLRAGAQTIVRELQTFATVRWAQPKADTVRWARGAEAEAEAEVRDGPISPARFSSYLQEWTTAFIQAVEQIAALQPPEVRRDVQETLQRLAPGWSASLEPPPRRHRTG